MNFIPDPKPEFLSPDYINFDVSALDITRPKKTLPYNVSFNGATFDIVPGPKSNQENTRRSEVGYGVLIWDVQVGNQDDQDKIKEGKTTIQELLKSTDNNKGTLNVSVPRGSVWLEKLIYFDMHAKRKLVDALIASKLDPFTGKEDPELLMKKCKFLVKDKNEKYNPSFPIVVKRKFDAGFVTTGFHPETSAVMRSKNPSFGWDNMDEYLKRGAVLHKAKGVANYASVTVRDGEIVSINIQFQIKRLIMSEPPQPKDECDSDECVEDSTNVEEEAEDRTNKRRKVEVSEEKDAEEN